jgi:hypothetical protein
VQADLGRLCWFDRGALRDGSEPPCDHHQRSPLSHGNPAGPLSNMNPGRQVAGDSVVECSGVGRRAPVRCPTVRADVGRQRKPWGRPVSTGHLGGRQGGEAGRPLPAYAPPYDET